MTTLYRYGGYVIVDFDEIAESEEQLQDILEREYGRCVIEINEESKISKAEYYESI